MNHNLIKGMPSSRSFDFVNTKQLNFASVFIEYKGLEAHFFFFFSFFYKLFFFLVCQSNSFSVPKVKTQENYITCPCDLESIASSSSC